MDVGFVLLLQDMELRYRFIYNAFPSLTEEVCHWPTSQSTAKNLAYNNKLGF